MWAHIGRWGDSCGGCASSGSEPWSPSYLLLWNAAPSLNSNCLWTRSISACLLVFNCIRFRTRYLCRVSAYQCLLQCCCYHCLNSIYWLTMRNLTVTLWYCCFALYFRRPRALDVGRHSKFMLIDWLIDWCLRSAWPRLQTGSQQNSQTSELNDMVTRAVVWAGVPATKELVGLVRRDGRRPDGMTQIQWCAEKLLVWDVTVVSTLTVLRCRRSSRTRWGRWTSCCQEVRKVRRNPPHTRFFQSPWRRLA